MGHEIPDPNLDSTQVQVLKVVPHGNSPSVPSHFQHRSEWCIYLFYSMVCGVIQVTCFVCRSICRACLRGKNRTKLNG
jgi:hypothetical protein